LPGHRKAVCVWQLDIQDHQIRIQIECLTQRIGPIRGIPYDSKSGLIQKQPAQAFSYGWGIVNNQNAKGFP
jgi:hypothetical protein